MGGRSSTARGGGASMRPPTTVTTPSASTSPHPLSSRRDSGHVSPRIGAESPQRVPPPGGVVEQPYIESIGGAHGPFPTSVARSPLPQASLAQFDSHSGSLTAAPVIPSSHPSRVRQGIPRAERDPSPQHVAQDGPPEAPSPVSRQSSTRLSRSPPFRSADKKRTASSRRKDAPGPRRSIRNLKPVVEIRTRPKRTRHTGRRTRAPSVAEESSSSDDEFIPSKSDDESDSDTGYESEEEEPPKKRIRTTVSAPRPPNAKRAYSSSSKAPPNAVANYSRKTDYERKLLTTLHGDIRCIFCPLVSGGVKPRGTIHRMWDSAGRHLRYSCPHFEKSPVYQEARAAGLRSKKRIVSWVLGQYKKIAVAQVHCRQDAKYKEDCAKSKKYSPAKVESLLARNAVLYKIEDCDCCPDLPRWSEYLASHGITGDGKSAGEKQKGKVEHRNAAESGRARGKKREVIEISDDDEDDEDVGDGGEAVEVIGEDVRMEDATDGRDVVDERGGVAEVEDEVKAEVVERKPKGLAKRPKVTNDEATRRKEREVIEMLDDDDAAAANGGLVELDGEDVKMEDAVEEQDAADVKGEDVHVKEAGKEEEVEEAAVKEEDVKEEKEDEEEEVVIREVHIKVKKTKPPVKKEEEMRAKLEEGVKQEEEMRTAPRARSRRARTKREDA